MTSRTTIIPRGLKTGFLSKIVSVVLLVLFLFCNQSQAQFSVTGTTPAANAIDVAVNSDITITFSANVDAATVSSSTIVIRSKQEGAVAGSFSVSGSSVTFNPTNDFRNGDRIFTTVTTSVTNSSATALNSAYTFSFNPTVLSSPETPPAFVEDTVSTAADGAFGVTAADLDGDGDLDLASASSDDDTIAWYENMNGDGSFGTQQVVTTAADGAISVASGDFDGDGDMDLASASQFDDKIAWYENSDGNGNFGAQQIISTNSDGPTSVIATDLDGDGDLDVAIASYLDDAIVWYENTDGNGNFSSEKIISTNATGARSVIASDIDGDGDLDLASASAGNDTIAWYENTNGTGAFGTQQVVIDSASSVQSIMAADLDSDGDLDLASASHGDDKIAWYENTDGAGSFGTQQVISDSADGAYSVVAADVDGDGDLDLASASGIDNTIAWYENTDGNGLFGKPRIVSDNSQGAFSVTTADIDGDGDIDLTSASASDNKISWYENESFIDIVSLDPIPNQSDVSTDASIDFHFDQAIDGTTLNSSTILISGDHSGKLDGNFSGGGTGSLEFVPSDNFSPGETISVTITKSVLSTGNDNLQEPLVYSFKSQTGHSPESPPVLNQHTISTTLNGPKSVTLGDLDGDGDLDLVSSKIAWYENTDGAGNFVSQEISNIDGVISMLTADLDGDGDLDLAWASKANDWIGWHENGGNGSFGSAKLISNSALGATSVAAGDFDGDGDLDLASASFDDDKIAWYENTDGKGTFGIEQKIDTLADGASMVIAADLDGDNDLDLASASYNNNTIAWYENTDGFGNFGASRIVSTVINSAISCEAADFDGDGDLDLAAAANRTSGYVRWFENTDGAGTFNVKQTISIEEPTYLSAVDFDGDGDQDFAFSAEYRHQIGWFKNSDGSGNFTGPIPEGDGTHSIVAGDLDGDEDIDFASVEIVENTASNPDDSINWHENSDTTSPVIISDQEFTIPEASGLGSVLGTVQATDSSSLGNWTIAGGNSDKDTDANPPFAVNSSTGELSVNDADDITFNSGAQVYELSLTVEDEDGNISSATPVDVLVEAIDVQITGTAGFDGWRFLGTPSTGQAYNSLLSGVWTQGATGASTTDGTPNVMRWDESAQQFIAVTDLTQTTSNGTGFIAYLFEDDDPTASGVDGGWPKTLDASGAVASGSVNFPVTFTDGVTDSLDGFNLVANPYPVSIDWEGTGWTKTNINDAIYIWDPNANSGNGAYKQRVGGVGDPINIIAPFQAFWVQANAASPALSVTEEALVDGGTFLKENGDRRREAGVLGLTISAGDFQDKMYVSFRPGGKMEQDSLDAFQLASLSGRFLELYSYSPDGTPMVIQSLPQELNTITELPLTVHSTEQGKATLSWQRPENVPGSWHFSLKDIETGQILVLNEPGSYRFELSRPTQARVKKKPGSSNRFGAQLKTADSGQKTARFLLRINPGLEGFAEGSAIPQKTELAQNYPNPFNPETVIRYGVPEQAKVQLNVYDALGRKVRTLIDKQQSPGRYEVGFDASELASGLYLYRLKVGGNVLTKKMMLIK